MEFKSCEIPDIIVKWTLTMSFWNPVLETRGLGAGDEVQDMCLYYSFFTMPICISEAEDNE